MIKYEFHERDLVLALKNYLENEGYWVKVTPNIRVKGYSQPSKRVIPDLLAIQTDHSLLIECKKHCDPSTIGMALGQALSNREIILLENWRPSERQIQEPIYIGLCFFHFLENFDEYGKNGYIYKVWTKNSSKLLDNMAKKISENIILFLARTNVKKSSYRQLEIDELYFEKIVYS